LQFQTKYRYSGAWHLCVVWFIISDGELVVEVGADVAASE